MTPIEFNNCCTRVQTLIKQGRIREARALGHWAFGAQNQQSLRRLQEGLSIPSEDTQPALFLDTHALAFGEDNYYLVTLCLTPGSATYQAVLDLLHTQFVFTPDGTPAPVE